jgi:excisionase family DNA binding protein
MKDKSAEPMNPKPEAAPAAAELQQAAHEFLSKQELARRLKRAARTVERWQRRGFIPYVKCGHSVLFNWADVVAHLQRNYRVCRQKPSAKAGLSPTANPGATHEK